MARRKFPADYDAEFDHVFGTTNRYGTMGEYDEGKYGTPVIARVSPMIDSACRTPSSERANG